MKKSPLHSVPSLILPLLLSTFGLLLPGSTALAQPQVPTTVSVSGSENYHFPYRMNQPEQTFELPEKLVEISGLSLTGTPLDQLAVIQDEQGIVFFIDKDSGEVLRELSFGKDGDYEGIEVVGEDVYIVKSSSKIYHIKKFGHAEQSVVKYSTPLTKEYDVEGLAYDRRQHALLLACKGEPQTDNSDPSDQKRFTRAVYRFPLQTHQLDTVPVMAINREDILEYFKNHPPLLKVDKDGEIKESNPEKLKCYPSAIAIHPHTGNYYVSSSKGKVLFVVSPRGQLLHLEKLDKRIHPQPEGLAFEEDGTLYVSNEGRDGPGRIYRFAYQKLKNQ
ncbi:MAG: SdiA-regulated domain-containing protein [Bacteroidota bacterium]